MVSLWQSLVDVFHSVLTGLYGLTGNYGVAIILITVLIRVVLWPLTQAQINNMRRMQQLQPEIQKIQKKYKGDQQKINEETMKLFRERNANPAYGCLPVLIQLPVLYALFDVLRTFQFRGAHFLWVPDLHSPDPYFVLPVLAGALTFVQSKMTTPQLADGPAAGTQRTMLYLMPLLIVWVTLRLPSGLALYWVTSSVFAVLQQWVAMRGDGMQPSQPQQGKA